ncbi:unnamed protein product [marine sediment metagenome]|uniref:Uncharacterized protein n=1 Tax=marine sediment metagenome TaxID=412755 RepID=X1RDB7_9ZZZZ
METWKKAAIAVGVGLLAFSFLPIWRSGRNGGQSLWGFLKHHSILNKSESLWLKPEELEELKRLAREKSGQ